MKQLEVPDPDKPDLHEAIGLFLSEWIRLERRFRDTAMRTASDDRNTLVPTARTLIQFGLLNPNEKEEFERIRRLRNNLVHGLESPNPADILDTTARLRKINDAAAAK